MTPDKLKEVPPVLENPTWADRIDYCRSILFLHGFITMTQSDKICVKLVKQWEEATKKDGDE